MIQHSRMLRLSFAASAVVAFAAVFGFTGCGNHAFNNVPCGNMVCGPGEGCLNGACVCSDPGLVSCQSGCYDLSSDPMHCGTCGHTCGQGTCVSGHCQCAPGQTDCGMGVGCADLSSDPLSCGNCGQSCGMGTCISGHCMCGTGQVACPGGCATLSADPMNCGTCGHDCGNGTCVSGACVCGTGQVTCPGQGCATLASDKQNCGMCGRRCQGPMNCVSGVCQ
jgi:hypothetical protein